MADSPALRLALPELNYPYRFRAIPSIVYNPTFNHCLYRNCEGDSQARRVWQNPRNVYGTVDKVQWEKFAIISENTPMHSH